MKMILYLGKQHIKYFPIYKEKNYDKILSKDYLNEKKFEDIIKDLDLKKEEEERIYIFFIVMNLIAEASVIKNIAKKIVDEFNEK